jgi:uncharacterized protein YcbK (DUF882 family)
MGDLTRNFSRWEFACKCKCGTQTIDYQLLCILQDLRNTLNRPITIISGHRCPIHNQRVGGASSSYHLRGMAADLIIENITPVQVFDFLNQSLSENQFGIGLYNDFVHLDVRARAARWMGKT